MDRPAEPAFPAEQPTPRGNRAAGEDPAVEFGQLTEFAGFMLRLAQLQAFEAFFADFGDRGIRPGQVAILMAVGENDGVRQGALAKALHIKRSNMAKIVGVLVGDGLLWRRVPATDRRSVELFLTAAGRALIDRTLPDLLASDRAATGALSGGERATLIRLLAKLAGTARPEARA